jgi:hypothetical protein
MFIFETRAILGFASVPKIHDLESLSIRVTTFDLRYYVAVAQSIKSIG